MKNRNKIILAALPILFFVGLLIGNLFVFRVKEQGKVLYETHCSSCHMEQGQGLAQLIPPISQSDWIAKNNEKLACVIRYGQQGEVLVNGTAYNQPMPANLKLTDVEIHNLINYIVRNFGNKSPKRSLEQVQQDLNNCK
jgi:mono/diheme cytochrome c family protein